MAGPIPSLEALRIFAELASIADPGTGLVYLLEQEGKPIYIGSFGRCPRTLPTFCLAANRNVVLDFVVLEENIAEAEVASKLAEVRSGYGPMQKRSSVSLMPPEYSGVVFLLEFDDEPVFIGSTMWADQRKNRWSETAAELDFVVLEDNISQEDLIQRRSYHRDFYKDLVDRPLLAGRPTPKKINEFIDSITTSNSGN